MVPTRSNTNILRYNAVCSSQPSCSATKLVAEEEGKTKRWRRRFVSGTLICLTGGVALSALDDLAIYHGYSSVVNGSATAKNNCNDKLDSPSDVSHISSSLEASIEMLRAAKDTEAVFKTLSEMNLNGIGMLACIDQINKRQ